MPTSVLAANTIVDPAPDYTEGWCTAIAAGQGACYRTPEQACQRQFDVYGAPYGSTGPVSAMPGSSWDSRQCTWHRANVSPIPAPVTFQCTTVYAVKVAPGRCTIEDYKFGPGKCEATPSPSTKHPINLISGSKYFNDQDFSTTDGALRLTRNFVSRPLGGLAKDTVNGYSPGFANWLSEFNVEVHIVYNWSSNNIATVIQGDGTGQNFIRQSDGSMKPYTDVWRPVPDTSARLKFVGTWPTNVSTVPSASTQWELTDSNNNVWLLQTRLNPVTGTYNVAYPLQQKRPDGTVLTFAYGADNGISTVTDQNGKVMTFTWLQKTAHTGAGVAYSVANVISSVTLPTGYKVNYTYDDPSAGSNPPSRLTKVEYLDGLGVVKDSTSYGYNNTLFPYSVTSVSDHNNVVRWKVTYDTQGRATKSEGPNGELSTTVAYAETGSTATRTTTDALGRQTVYNFTHGSLAYNTKLVSVQGLATTNCPASAASNTFGTDNYVSTSTDAEGRVTKYTYNTLGQTTQITEGFGTAAARTTGYSYNPNFDLVSQSVEAGLTTNYTYDTQGRLTVLNQVDTTSQTVPYTTNGQSRTWTYTYGTSGNSLGKLVSIDGPLSGNGDTRSFTYNASGYLASATNEVGKTTTVTAWDWRGAPLTVVDPNSVSTSFTYDIHGRVKTITINPGASQSQFAYDYDLGGNVAKITLPTGGWLEYTYDTASRLTKVKNDKNETIDLTPNAVGDPILSVTKTASGTITAQQSMVYDELGRLIQTLGSASTMPTQFAYDKVDNLKTVTDGRGKVSNTAFDALDRVVTATNPDSQSVNYAYNAQDVVTSHKDGRNLETTFVTNGFGEVIREVSPDRGTRTYWYDNAGRLTKINDADSVETILAYDNAGRLTGKTFTGAPQEAMTFTYDSVASGNKGNGRLTSVTEQSGSSAFTYDAQGRVTTDAKTIQGLNYAVGYDYNANGQVTQTTLPSGRVITFTRDADGMITGITTKPTSSGTVSIILSSMTYAPFGALTTATYGNGLALTRTFNTNDWLTRIAVKDGTTAKFDLSYDYYDDGRLGEIDDNAATGRTVYMSLSNSGRLTYANGPWGQESYSYDAAGNRIGSYLTVGGVTTSNNEITAGTSNRLVQVQDNASVVKRSLTYRTGGDLYSDAIASGATYTYHYSSRKRLVTVKKNAADAAYYGYDFREQRVWRRLFNGGSSSEIHYIFDQKGHLLAEHNGYSGALLREYIWADDMPIAVIDKTSGTAVTYFIHDGHLNEPQVMTNAAKAKVWDAYMTPFGSAKVFTTATANVDIRLPGQWYQAEAAGAGLNQNHHRDYDPSLGRYIQVDPIGLNGGQNPYAYVDGMVYDYADFEGLAQHSPNSQHCLDLAKKIAGKQAELERRYKEYEQNRLGLPERKGPGEKLSETRRGHRTMINKEDRKLREYQGTYDDECRGPPSPPPLPAKQPNQCPIPTAVPATAPREKLNPAVVGAAVVAVAGATAAAACAIAEPCGAVVATVLAVIAGTAGTGVVLAQ